jgi:hypothetical protein
MVFSQFKLFLIIFIVLDVFIIFGLGRMELIGRKRLLMVQDRPLGSYEQLLSRTVSSTGQQALSHVSVAIFNTILAKDKLETALAYSVSR